MSVAPIVAVQNVSKAYAVYERPLDVVKEALFGGTRHDLFWALKDVSLDVHEGQRIGIIGPNGAGKSTLLKLIAGTLQQTAGTIEVNGRISAMLSLTSFLSPDETGLENIRFNLIVNGADEADIPRLTEEIVEFTELGAFIHAPVRTYSSGMNARLAFAISTSVIPDILIVDEVLSAGDAYFASKATMRMVELTNQGRALLFVSHAMNAIQLLCDTAIWLDGGVIREAGPVEEIAARYEAEYRRQEDEVLRAGNVARRDRLSQRIAARELGRSDLARLRLTGPGGRITDTHYVRRISLELGDEPVEVSLDFADIDDPGVVACLDLVDSEWGRPHHRRDVPSRALTRGSSPLRGGHILVKPRTDRMSPVPVKVTIESTSVTGSEPLVMQRMDVAEGSWVNLLEVGREKLPDGWQRSVFEGNVDRHDAMLQEAQLAKLLEESRPDVELMHTVLVVDGEEALNVRERQPFSIGVRIRANRPVRVADVGLTFIRADGVYVFWQSSGQVGANLENLSGERVVWFDFDPNLFGPGDYEVTAEIANGFDPEGNFPYSEIFDRRVNALRFTVTREWSLIMHGTINHRFPVRVEDADTGSAQPTRKLSSSEAQ